MTKEQLQRYRVIDLERRQIKRELERVEALLTSPGGSNLDGLPRASGVSDPVGDKTVKKESLQERYRAKLRQLEAAQTEIEDAIESLDGIERVLLRYYYIDGMTMREISEAIHYGVRHTKRLHKQALQKLI